MAKKIFVSYKYADSKVLALAGIDKTTVRDYVDELAKLLKEEDHIYKGENDGEDIGSLADATIGSKLGDKIFDSTLTIVLISKGMKSGLPEKDQWIPWEIAYSLKEQSRENGNSKTNALLAVVLPDENGSYEYYMTENVSCNSTSFHTNTYFQILRDNMFNLKDKESNMRECNGTKIYNGEPSYIYSVKWIFFKDDINPYINKANEIRQNLNLYKIVKTVE